MRSGRDPRADSKSGSRTFICPSSRSGATKAADRQRRRALETARRPVAHATQKTRRSPRRRTSCRQAGRRHPGRAGRRPRHFGRTLRRGRRLIGGVARRKCGRPGGSSPKGARGKQELAPIQRLFRIFGEKLAKVRRIAFLRCSGEKEEILDVSIEAEKPRHRDRRIEPLRIKDHAPLRHRGSRPAGRQMADRNRAVGVGAPKSRSISASTCGCGCGTRPNRKP